MTPTKIEPSSSVVDVVDVATCFFGHSDSVGHGYGVVIPCSKGRHQLGNKCIFGCECWMIVYVCDIGFIQVEKLSCSGDGGTFSMRMSGAVPGDARFCRTLRSWFRKNDDIFCAIPAGPRNVGAMETPCGGKILCGVANCKQRCWRCGNFKPR